MNARARTYRALLLTLPAIGAACVMSISRRPASEGAATVPAITPGDLRRRTFLLADDSMMGRETGSEGAYKATAYVAAEFKRLGLEPAGDDGSYFQAVPMFTLTVDPTSRLEVDGAVLRAGPDFVPNNSGAPGRTLSGAEVIFGGHGADSSSWISTSDAADRLVVLDYPTGVCCPGGGNPHWRGAAAVAIIGLEQASPEGIARLLNGRPALDSSRASGGANSTIYVTARAGAALLGASSLTLTPGARGRRVSGHFDILRTRAAFQPRNVVGILRGSDPALNHEYVSLTAHHDHVGFDRTPVDHDSIRAFDRVVRPMGADSRNRPATPEEAARIRTILDSLRREHPRRLDSIRNGADDDASGTASILEIAEAFALVGARPRRSILFVSHTGEEGGLLGSRWYSSHSTVPIDSIVAEIDQDMVGRGLVTDFPRGGTGAGGPQYMEVVGAKRLSREFGDSLEAVNARQGVPFAFDYTYDAPGHPLQYYCRADHYNYARYGIPSVAFSRGEHLDYHQVTDEAQYLSYDDMARVTRLVFDAARVIGNMPHRPALDAPKQADPLAPCRQ